MKFSTKHLRLNIFNWSIKFILLLAIFFNWKLPLISQDIKFHSIANQNYINEIKQDGDTMWIATAGGIQKRLLTGELLMSYDSNNGLVSSYINKIFIDYNGNKIFSSSSSIFHISENKIVNHSIPYKWHVNSILSVGKSNDSILFLGMGLSGDRNLLTIKKGDTSFIPESNFTNSIKYDMEKDHKEMQWFGKKRLWVGTDEGLYSYQDGIWVNYSQTNIITGIATNDFPYIWISKEDEVSRFDGENWVNFANENFGDKGIPIIDIGANNGNVWVTKWNELYYYESNKWNKVPIIGTPKAVEVTKDGTAWVGTDGEGIFLVNKNGVLDTLESPRPIPHNSIEDIKIDKNNNIWLATGNGIARYNGLNYTSYSWVDVFQQYQRVYDLEFDADNNIWAATQSGILKFDGSNWITILDHRAHKIVLDNDGNIWFTDYSGSLHYHGNDMSSIRLPDGIIKDLLIDENGTLWIASSKGLLMYDGEFVEKIKDSEFTCLILDETNKLYAGTYYEGIYILKNNVVIDTIFRKDLFENYSINSMTFVGPDLYVSTSKELSRFSNDEWTIFGENKLPRSVKSLYSGSGNDLWVGTNEGLKFSNIGGNFLPTDIKLNRNEFNPDEGNNAFVSKIITIDQNVFDFYKYEIVDDLNLDGEYFKIIDNELWTKEQIPEHLETVNIKLRSTDLGEASVEKIVTLKLTDVVSFNEKLIPENENNVIIYPNPNNGLFELSFFNNSDRLLVLKVVNLNGEIMYFEKFLEKKGMIHKKIQLGNVKGSFLVVIDSEIDRVLSKKIVVK